MNKIKIAMAVMAAVMALSMSAVAFAQTPTPPNPPKTVTPSPYAQTFWQELATNLGVTVEKLQAAIQAALKSTVAKMLSDGKLTQQQVDNANAAIDKLPFNRQPFGGFFGGRGFKGERGGFAMGTTAFDAAAQKLGMATQELMTELRNGKTLSDVATEKKVSADDLKAAIVTAMNAKIDQAVKDGHLTQAQADQIKAQVDKMTLDDAFGMGMHKGWGFDRGFGPGKGGFKGNMPFGRRGNQAPQPATPQGSSS
jgi:uncharacterized protein YidB (DUF937 family)